MNDTGYRHICLATHEYVWTELGYTRSKGAIAFGFEMLPNQTQLSTYSPRSRSLTFPRCPCCPLCPLRSPGMGGGGSSSPKMQAQGFMSTSSSPVDSSQPLTVELLEMVLLWWPGMMAVTRWGRRQRDGPYLQQRQSQTQLCHKSTFLELYVTGHWSPRLIGRYASSKCFVSL